LAIAALPEDPDALVTAAGASGEPRPALSAAGIDALGAAGVAAAVSARRGATAAAVSRRISVRENAESGAAVGAAGSARGTLGAVSRVVRRVGVGFGGAGRGIAAGDRSTRSMGVTSLARVVPRNLALESDVIDTSADKNRTIVAAADTARLDHGDASVRSAHRRSPVAGLVRLELAEPMTTNVAGRSAIGNAERWMSPQGVTAMTRAPLTVRSATALATAFARPTPRAWMNPLIESTSKTLASVDDQRTPSLADAEHD
jgi:hypothetical protein